MLSGIVWTQSAAEMNLVTKKVITVGSKRVKPV